MGRSLFRIASTASGWNVSCRTGYLPPTGFRRPFHGAPEPRPTIGFAHRGLRPCNRARARYRARPRALIVAGDKSWIGISSFRHTPLGFYAETFFSLPRIEWYARLHAGFEHLAGH
jgi:hypothetical protein